MKKHLYWPFIVISFPIGLILLFVILIGLILVGIVSVGYNLLGRLEWWICDEHIYTDQPLNPFNDKLSDVFMRVFDGY